MLNLSNFLLILVALFSFTETAAAETPKLLTPRSFPRQAVHRWFNPQRQEYHLTLAPLFDNTSADLGRSGYEYQGIAFFTLDVPFAAATNLATLKVSGPPSSNILKSLTSTTSMMSLGYIVNGNPAAATTLPSQRKSAVPLFRFSKTSNMTHQTYGISSRDLVGEWIQETTAIGYAFSTASDIYVPDQNGNKPYYTQPATAASDLNLAATNPILTKPTPFTDCANEYLITTLEAEAAKCVGSLGLRSAADPTLPDGDQFIGGVVFPSTTSWSLDANDLQSVLANSSLIPQSDDPLQDIDFYFAVKYSRPNGHTGSFQIRVYDANVPTYFPEQDRLVPNGKTRPFSPLPSGSSWNIGNYITIGDPIPNLHRYFANKTSQSTSTKFDIEMFQISGMHSWNLIRLLILAVPRTQSVNRSIPIFCPELLPPAASFSALQPVEAQALGDTFNVNGIIDFNVAGSTVLWRLPTRFASPWSKPNGQVDITINYCFENKRLATATKESDLQTNQNSVQISIASPNAQIAASVPSNTSNNNNNTRILQLDRLSFTNFTYTWQSIRDTFPAPSCGKFVLQAPSNALAPGSIIKLQALNSGIWNDNQHKFRINNIAICAAGNSTSTCLPFSTTTSANADSSSAEGQSSSTLEGRAIIGIIVGTVVAFVVLVIAAVFILARFTEVKDTGSATLGGMMGKGDMLPGPASAPKSFGDGGYFARDYYTNNVQRVAASQDEVYIMNGARPFGFSNVVA